MKTFRGVVHVKESGVILDAGGVEVRLDGDRAQLAALDGLFTTIVGEQEGDVIRQAAPAQQAERAATTASGAELFEPVIAAVRANRDALSTIPGVLGVTPGFRLQGDGLSQEPAIIIVTKAGESVGELPSEVSGIPVDTRIATPREMLQGLLPLPVWEGVQPEAAPNIHYVPPDPAEVELKEHDVHNITCHIGPDSGWSTLKPFLEGTSTSLTVAMYEFYAQYIIDTVTQLGRESDATLKMILQVSGNDREIEANLRDSWGNRLVFTPASVSGANRIFNNSYHTKVAVRDSKAFWLSSGNWSPNSQPVVTPNDEQTPYRKGNREWHVIVEDEALAQMYEKFIQYDMRKAGEVGIPEATQVMPDLLIPLEMFQAEAEVVQDHLFSAKPFAVSGEPVRVKPLMSPDNYARGILELIQGAQHSLYLQFSYITQPSQEIFDQIITAVSNKMQDDNVDVRVLVGSNQEPDHSNVLIGTRGWKRSKFRLQKSKVHNKGVLIDGKIAVVGSNNWSSDGTQYNRDTSLVFFSRPITQYFTEVFMFDWNNLSKPISGGAEVSPVLAPESGPTPLGMVRIPWQAWYDE